MARAGARLPTVTLYAEKHEVESAFHKANKAWSCAHCGTSFNLMENMGALDCKQHPGYVQEDGRWSCCGIRINPQRWAKNWPIQRIYTQHESPCWSPPYQTPVKVPGCQRCDHNTSTLAFQHSDAQSIADLSAILPYMNGKFPFHLRNGFDNGVLRRCDPKRRIHVPQRDGVPMIGAVVTYTNPDGEESTYDVVEGGTPPMGMETSALDPHGRPIEQWW